LSGDGVQAVLPDVGDNDGAIASDDFRGGKPHAASPTSDDGYLTH
jgi:hypothetical protein